MRRHGVTTDQAPTPSASPAEAQRAESRGRWGREKPTPSATPRSVIPGLVPGTHPSAHAAISERPPRAHRADAGGHPKRNRKPADAGGHQKRNKKPAGSGGHPKRHPLPLLVPGQGAPRRQPGPSHASRSHQTPAANTQLIRSGERSRISARASGPCLARERKTREQSGSPTKPPTCVPGRGAPRREPGSLGSRETDTLGHTPQCHHGARPRDPFIHPRRAPYAFAFASAWSRSAMISAASSMPIDSRTTSSPAPAAARCSLVSWLCVVDAG